MIHSHNIFLLHLLQHQVLQFGNQIVPRLCTNQMKSVAFSFTYNNSAVLADIKHSKNGGSEHKANFNPSRSKTETLINAFFAYCNAFNWIKQSNFQSLAK